MKKLLLLYGSFVLVFLLTFGSNEVIAKANTNEEETQDLIMTHIDDELKKGVARVELPEPGKSVTKVYEILKKDGEKMRTSFSIENVTPVRNSLVEAVYPVSLGGEYVFTWTVSLGSLGGEVTIRLWYSVSSNSYYVLSGSTASIHSTPPQTYSIVNESMYYTNTSGRTLTATGYTSYKPSLVNITYNKYYDVSITGNTYYVDITFNTY